MTTLAMVAANIILIVSKVFTESIIHALIML